MMKKINISLIGKPGSGKGTYGNGLSKLLDCPLVVMGDVLRKHVQDGTEIGREVENYQREGKLANDYLVSRALLEHLKELPSLQGKNKKTRFGFILDGFPRTLAQAKLLLDIDETNGANDLNNSMNDDLMLQINWPRELKISFAVNIDVPDFICIGKMKGRRHCLKCEESFNLTNIDTPDGFFMPPKLPVPYPCRKCDMDKDWSKRNDDTEEIFVKRMQEYHEQSACVTNFFAEHGKRVDFVPYKGIADMPILEKIVTETVEQNIL